MHGSFFIFIFIGWDGLIKGNRQTTIDFFWSRWVHKRGWIDGFAGLVGFDVVLHYIRKTTTLFQAGQHEFTRATTTGCC
jgi:hypothetical protein